MTPTLRLRPELTAVTESPLVQIATLAESMPGSIKLCYGESDMVTPDFICRAADEAARAGHTFYTHTAGYPALREAIARKIHELHGVTYRPSEVMCTVGGTMAIYMAIRAFIGPGDNAVVISPAYAVYVNGIAMCGGTARQVPLARTGNRFQLDLDRVGAAIDGGTRLLIVNSPSNPTGWMISIDEQRALADLAAERGVTILADEVYERFAFDQSVAPSFARLVSDKDRLIVVNSFSKTYNMTGWRLGWAQASEAAIGAMWKGAEFITSNPTAMVQQAGIVALRDGEQYVRTLRVHYAQCRERVKNALGGLKGVSLPDPQGAFYAFPRIEGLEDSSGLARKLLQDTGLALAPGSGFGPDGEGHLRMCFAATADTVSAALARFTTFLTLNS